MEETIKELEQIGVELFNKYGTDCYTIRCRLHDAREKLKALTIDEAMDEFTCKTCKTHEKIWSRKNDDWYCKNCGYRCK